MTWLRLDDNMLDHQKWRRAVALGGDTVLAVWLRLVSWCSRNLTDGVIPADMVEAVAETKGDRNRRRALQALVSSSLVARDAQGQCTIVDYLERNPSRSDVLHQRAAAAGRKEKHRLKHSGTPESQRGSPSPERPAATPHPNPIPIPSRPIPEEAEAPAAEPAQGRRTTWTRLGDDFVVTERIYAEATMIGLPRDRVDARVKLLRNKPIGGRHGVFDREQHIVDLLPSWKVWDANDAAATFARASPVRGASNVQSLIERANAMED